MKRGYRLTPRGSRRNADLFYADLVGGRADRPRRGFAVPAAPLTRYPAAPVPSTPLVPDDEVIDVEVFSEVESEVESDVESEIDTEVDYEVENEDVEDIAVLEDESAAVSDQVSEDAYAPPDVRPFIRNSSASFFRTSPDPVAVTDATQWPQATTDADGASARALRALDVSDEDVATFSGAGLTAMRPIASVFGEAALIELLRRLRYSPARLARPPHSYANEAALSRAFGRPFARQVVLSIRTLLAIPGHFRELARRAGTDREAFALENLGWLLMESLRADIHATTSLDFWLPSAPAFVTAFPAATSGLSPQVSQLIAARSLTDAAVDAAEYHARFTSWVSGAPGRMWRLETGRDKSTRTSPGAPFYREPFTIPAPIDSTAQRTKVNAAWTRRVADFDAGRTTVPLTQCDNSYLTPLHVMSPRISLRGLQLRSAFPALSTAPFRTTLTGLAAVQPAFEAVFQAIADLGWNDLLFETQGMGCFRGKKIPGNPAAARRMSEHALGVAIDLNVFENGQNIAGSMDPRIVALFEAFRFRWGKGFSTPDPMHFEYAGEAAPSR